jgi:iron complex outermembrane receptor protein
VVNFIMKNRYEGFEVTAQTAASSKHDAQSQTASLTYGTNLADDRGHLSLALDYTNDRRLTSRRRGFSSGTGYKLFVQNPDNPAGDPNIPDQVPLGDIRFFDFSPAGAVDTDVDGIPNFNGDGSPWNPGRFIAPFYQQGGDGTSLAGFLGDTLPDRESVTMNALFDFAISDHVRFFSELAFDKSDSFSEGGPTFDNYLLFTPDGPFVPPAIAAAGAPFLGVTRDHFDLGVRGEDTERKTKRAVLGIDGALSSNLDFEASYTYGETNVKTRIFNNRYNDRFAAALDAVIDPASGDVVCASELDPTAEPFNLQFQEWNKYPTLPGTWAGSFTPGAGDCVPINLFGEGSPSLAAIDWIYTDSLTKAKTQQHVVQAYLRGNSETWLTLPAGPVGFVVGVEWRKENVSVKPADETRLGLAFANQFDDEGGEQKVAEVFAEIDVPLLADAKFVEFLALDAAVRYSDYSTTSAATTWKLGLVWQPLTSLTLRATLAEAARAPGIQELFTPLGQSFEDIPDPCDVNNLPNGTEFRVDNCTQLLTPLGVDATTWMDPNSFSISGLNGGNPDLEQETADTITWGFIYKPEYFEGLTFSADWYDIDLVDAINFPSPQNAAALCVDLPTLNNQFCDLIERADDGAISGFLQEYKNVTSITTRGVDFRVSYSFDLTRWGSVNLDLSGNKLQEHKTVNIPGAASVSSLGQRYSPEWQGNLDVQWHGANTNLRWQMHYFDETNRFDDVTVRNNPNIVAKKYLRFGRKLTHDVYASQRLGEFTVFAGINNLTNEKPDIGEVFYPVSAVGRYLYAGLRFKL